MGIELCVWGVGLGLLCVWGVVAEVRRLRRDREALYWRSIRAARGQLD